MRDPIPNEAAVFIAAEHGKLVGALSLYVGDRHLAEELAQEALLRACRRWEKVSVLDSPGGWTWRVAVNLANSHWRRRRAARRARRRLSGRADRVHHDPDVADHEAVRAAVSSLPRRQRTALVLRYFLDLSAAQTAERMDTTDDAVRSLTKRAVAALRDEFDSVDERVMTKERGDAI